MQPLYYSSKNWEGWTGELRVTGKNGVSQTARAFVSSAYNAVNLTEKYLEPEPAHRYIKFKQPYYGDRKLYCVPFRKAV